MTDFEALLRAFTDGEVEFIVVGGVAAVAHGSARLTQDLDLVYSRRPENVRAIASALAPYSPYLRGAPPGLPFQLDEETILRGLNFTLRTDVGDVDLLGEIIGGGDYDALLPHTIVLKVFGMEVRCLDLDWLIRVKRAAGRPQDLEVLAEPEILEEEQPKD